MKLLCSLVLWMIALSAVRVRADPSPTSNRIGKRGRNRVGDRYRKHQMTSVKDKISRSAQKSEDNSKLKTSASAPTQDSASKQADPAAAAPSASASASNETQSIIYSTNSTSSADERRDVITATPNNNNNNNHNDTDAINATDATNATDDSNVPPPEPTPTQKKQDRRQSKPDIATRRTIYQARTTLSGVTIDDLSPDETMFVEHALTKAFQTIQDESADDNDDTHIQNLIVVPQTNGDGNDGGGRKLGKDRSGAMNGGMHDGEDGDESGRMLFWFFNTPPSFGQSWYYYDVYAFFDATCFLCGGSQYDDDDDGYGHFSDKWDKTSSDEDDDHINHSYDNGDGGGGGDSDEDDGHRANRWGASSTSTDGNFPDVAAENDDTIPIGSYQAFLDDDDEYYNNKFGDGGRMLKETVEKAAGVKAKTNANIVDNGKDAAATNKRKKHREVEEAFCAMLRDGPFDSFRGVEDCEITYGPI